MAIFERKIDSIGDKKNYFYLKWGSDRSKQVFKWKMIQLCNAKEVLPFKSHEILKKGK